jgi:hypothetical protein
VNVDSPSQSSYPPSPPKDWDSKHHGFPSSGIRVLLVILQTEVGNRKLSTMLRVVLKKIFKMWEECLHHVEFAYNRSLHSTTKMCPFEIVNVFLPHALIDLMPLPSSEKLNFDATQHVELMLKLHRTTKENIERMNDKYKISGDKGRKQ